MSTSEVDFRTQKTEYRPRTARLRPCAAVDGHYDPPDFGRVPVSTWVDETGSPRGRHAVGHLFASGRWPVSPGGVCRLGVLGRRTSSEQAAHSLIARLSGIVDFAVVAFDSFESLLAAILSPSAQGAVEFAVVPNAAPTANTFYMAAELFPMLIFPCATPTYGIATRSGADGLAGCRRIALFDVTLPVLVSLIPDHRAKGVQLVPARSTADAARMVADGRADAAVTQADAVEAFHLAWVAQFGSIRMIWSAFARCDRFDPRGPVRRSPRPAVPRAPLVCAR